MAGEVNFDITAFCELCGVKDSKRFVALCEQLYDILSEENAKYNLTRIRDENEFWVKHVADSLAIGQFFPELSSESLSLADIGCGGGFPSLIIASAFPLLQITAVDSIAKKTGFVKLAAEKLGLDNLEVFTGRSREMNRKDEWQNRFDIVTARAVADARTIYREARNFPKDNGRFILYKTPEQAEEDFPQVAKASEKYGIKWACTDVFELPENAGKRLFLFSSPTE
jgi:16S rRNA (guanine527-N7)-methyltransferase